MAGIILALVLYVSFGLWLRYMGKRDNPRFAVIQPVNTTGLILKSGNSPIRDQDGKIIGVKNDGGDLVDVLETVPGSRLNKKKADPMDWFIEPGIEPRGSFYHLFGVQIIGLLNQMRINPVRTFRWGRKAGEDKYRVQPIDSFTAFPHFSGQHDLEMKGVETKEIVKFDMRFNFTLEERFPVRVRLRTADAYASFSMIVMSHVNMEMDEVDPKEFLGAAENIEKKAKEELDKKKVELKQKLLLSFDKIRAKVEDETGLHMREVNLPDIDFDEETRKLLERLTKAKLEGEADLVTAHAKANQVIIAAEADNKVGKLDNEVVADRIRILKEVTDNPGLAATFKTDRQAAAYEKNKTVTHWVNGSGGVVTSI